MISASTTQSHWLARYRRLAAVLSGLTGEDPRFPTIMTLLQECEQHERANNDEAFIRTAKEIVQLVGLPTPPSIPTDMTPLHPSTSRL